MIDGVNFNPNLSNIVSLEKVRRRKKEDENKKTKKKKRKGFSSTATQEPANSLLIEELQEVSETEEIEGTEELNFFAEEEELGTGEFSKERKNRFKEWLHHDGLTILSEETWKLLEQKKQKH